MTWFVVDLEIFLFGKETEYVESNDKNSAIIIAKNKVIKKYSCPIEYIQVITCYEKT